MRRAAWQILALAGVLLVVCAACRWRMGNTYTAYVPIPHGLRAVEAEDVRVIEQTPGIVDAGAPRRSGEYFSIPIQPLGPGQTWIDIDNGPMIPIGLSRLRVGRFGTVYDAATGGFTGDTVALVAFTTFCLAVAAIMFRAYRRTRGPAYYAYTTILAVGFGLFALLTGLTMLAVTLRHVLRPRDYTMLSAYEAISGAGFRFVRLTSPLMLAFAAAMAVSNVALLRHEPFSPRNVLGLGVALILVAGEALAFWLDSHDPTGREWRRRVGYTLQNVYATGFSYFECILIGAVVCGLRAAKHVPAGDADYIIILGCRFRRDGTLTPLLRGRVDRAVAFWRSQRERTGRTAVLMPSGGQGADEPMPEAQAMRRYLLAQGVPEGAIRVEERARNTYQNMEYCRALIEREMPGARVVYATTNYHVFRSGVWASLAGLPAEGMGSPTRWWYWPNAFMRECVGLLVNRVPQELLLLAAMFVFFGALSMALG